MAQLPCIGLYKSCIYLPFGDCAMYFDHGVYLNMMEKLPPRPRYARAASASAPGGCRAPLKKKKTWDGKRVGMETLLKMGLMQSSFPFFGGSCFFLLRKKYRTVSSKLVLHTILLPGFVWMFGGNSYCFFRKYVETMERNPTSTIYRKVIPSRIQRPCGPNTRCYFS